MDSQVAFDQNTRAIDLGDESNKSSAQDETPELTPDGCESSPTKPNVHRTSKSCGKRKKTGSMYRKAPQAPKRFKPAYICFSMAKHKEIKKELGSDATVSDVSKHISQVWHSLPPNERAHWDKIAEEDKKRYEAEKAAYKGPWKILSKPSKTDANAPKRPMSSFLYYAQKYRAIVKKENSELSNTEVSKLLGVMWKNAPEDEKQKYIQYEQDKRALYNSEISDWHQKQAEDNSSPPENNQEKIPDAGFLSLNNPPSYMYSPQYDNASTNGYDTEQQTVGMQPYYSHPPAPQSMMPPPMQYGMYSQPTYNDYSNAQSDQVQHQGYHQVQHQEYPGSNKVLYSSSYPTYEGKQSYTYNSYQDYSTNNTAAPQYNNALFNTHHAPIRDVGHDYYNRTINSYQEY
mmetsp:Transcript_31388/g.71806  ORF Transcript_31388/g.71806 Transcript_31388/m.71806 type:complete len:401 (-) Transcript_31388:147-1349(-)